MECARTLAQWLRSASTRGRDTVAAAFSPNPELPMRRQLAIALGLVFALAGPRTARLDRAAARRRLPPDDRDLRSPLAAITERENGYRAARRRGRSRAPPEGRGELGPPPRVPRGRARGADEWVADARRAATRMPRRAAARGRRGPAAALPARGGFRARRSRAALSRSWRSRVPMRGSRAGRRAGAIELRLARPARGRAHRRRRRAGLARSRSRAASRATSLSDLDDLVRATAHDARARPRDRRAARGEPLDADAWRAVWAHEYARAQSGFSAVPASARADAAQQRRAALGDAPACRSTISGSPTAPARRSRTLSRSAAQVRDVLRGGEALAPRAARAPNPAGLSRLLAPNSVGQLILELRPPFDDVQRRAATPSRRSRWCRCSSRPRRTGTPRRAPGTARGSGSAPARRASARRLRWASDPLFALERGHLLDRRRPRSRERRGRPAHRPRVRAPSLVF